MTKVLVLGAGGMLGHKVLQRLGSRFEIVGAVRIASEGLIKLARMSGGRLVAGLDAEDPATVDRLLLGERPDVIVNCVGVIKQAPDGADAARLASINARFPHILAKKSTAIGARLIQLSTDCVFSGTRGRYSELDTPDPVDLYGESKLMGELTAPNSLTLRTSLIGRELRGFRSLLEWFLRQPKGTAVKGFTRAIFSGPTNIVLADEIGRIIELQSELSGVYHLSVEPIAKHDLLRLLRNAFNLQLEIVADEAFQCDRSLVSERYRQAAGFVAPSWESMISDLATDPTPYHELAVRG
jgi:dTDP-4-dehydrorhamnose reductase